MVEAQHIIFKAEVVEDLLDNVRRRHALEDPAIRLSGKKPQPRNHLRVIAGEPSVPAALGEPADEAVEAAFRIDDLQMDRNVLSDDAVEIDIVVLGKEFELKAEQLRDRLLTGKAAEQKGVGPQRRIDSERPRRLREPDCSHSPSLSLAVHPQPELVDKRSASFDFIRQPVLRLSNLIGTPGPP